MIITTNIAKISQIFSHFAVTVNNPDSKNQIYTDLQDLINIVSALIGIAVVASIIIGGIQYTMAGGDSQKVSAAKNRIRNAIIALVAYFFIFAFLEYLISGGIV